MAATVTTTAHRLQVWTVIYSVHPAGSAAVDVVATDHDAAMRDARVALVRIGVPASRLTIVSAHVDPHHPLNA